MLLDIFYLLLAGLGVGFLIFIHELGHYWMARRVGIRIEVFSIGFGKPILEWERNGVKWRLCWIPFGGYVRPAGGEKQGNLEPHQIEGGLFAASPWARIKFAAMGPIVNILFAFVAFSLLWFAGGREKPFSSYTNYIGFVSSDSGPYDAGIRPGDLITAINQKPVRGFEQIITSAVLDSGDVTMSGFDINYYTGNQKPFTYAFDFSPKEEGSQKARQIQSLLSPAQVLLTPSKLPPGSPLENSGLQERDRIIWVDGKLIFSQHQLIQEVNSDKVLLTIQRDSETFLTRVPRLQIQDLRLTSTEFEELDDWRHEIGIEKQIQLLQFIPYNLSSRAEVEGTLAYIDEEAQAKEFFQEGERAPIERPLIRGDQILAVQGEPINSAYDVLDKLQTKKNLIVVKQEPKAKPLSWKEADKGFVEGFAIPDLLALTSSIGTSTPLSEKGSLRLLPPITPIPLEEFPLSETQAVDQKKKLEKRQKEIEEIEEGEKKEVAKTQFDRYKKRLLLGITTHDQSVLYNPNPITLSWDVIKNTYRTIYALITGGLSPKVLGGPISLVQIAQIGWSQGIKDGIFWLGMISLNLALFNLLPIPALDGGHICFALIEKIRKKPLSIKTMERLILPFVIILIGLFVYLTFNDLLRIIGQFLS